MDRLPAAQPVTYGPDPWLVGVWVALVGAPLPISVWIAVTRGGASGTLEGILLCSILPIAVAAFALRFRVTFTTEAFIYRRWGPTISVRYREIDGIEVTNVTPVSGMPIGAFVVTTDGRRLPFWPKLFPMPAIRRFMELGEGSDR